MDDLIVRLRRGFGGIVPPVSDEAANAIESLQDRITSLKAALSRHRAVANWAAGRLLDAGDVEGHDKVLKALSEEPT